MRKGRKVEEHSVDVLFILALFCVFAGSAVLVMTFGANVYQRTVSQMEDNYNARVSLSYLANQVRQHDESGAITLQTLDGDPALVLADGPESDYATFIYYYDGALRELYCAKDDPLGAADGLPIVALESFEMTLDDQGRLQISAAAEGGKNRSLTLTLRSAGGGEGR